MTIRRNHKYYIDEYKTFNEYLKEFMNIVKDKKIKSFIPFSGLSWTTHSKFADKVYDTDDVNYLIFDDNTILKFNYNWFSMIDIELTQLDSLREAEIKGLEERKDEQFDFDCYGETIVDFELNRFNDEYIIEPSSDTIRPEVGDYFKEIIFHLSNGKKICICAENAEFDGYCDIWLENNSSKGVFNGAPHKAWWN